MTILGSLDRWKLEGTISAEQHARLSGLAREEPFSVFLEINALLYAGILAFVGGLGWTVATWSRQLGDVVIVAVLSLLLTACFWFCFRQGPAWTTRQTSINSSAADYVLYLGCLVWCIQLGYLETRFHLLSGQWDVYLLLTAILFLVLAYRFDNRFVLSLALTSLAGWFGVGGSHLLLGADAKYRDDALMYCIALAIPGTVSRQLNMKSHFFATYLNILANVLFVALVSGVFEPNFGGWLFTLLLTGLASLGWGVTQRQFVFVAYAAVYSYIGISSLLLRHVESATFLLLYCVISAFSMVLGLVLLGQRFARPE
jgi:hypothetical protein